ncbi:dual serine/threonine and tyrosine protein kinase-like isoform X3 [Ruditapes philippinarum]|uniref:dual serine/threonine and tyrosine protein kinase-like isoform X3 n=1 Tax=Ruditapes philippinarum TaxID=129788 RepID=UPI00295B2DD4|nr:dual serine/threonine and tyrosine protein kinase-like isoform X3 [Ruditapes philippinarum]
MPSTLVSGIKRYCNHSKRLQAILEETKRCFDDINESGKNENGPLLPLEVLHEEEEEILSTADKLPGIVVLGQNEYCKSRIVNELFQRTIFPTFDSNDNDNRYRTVRFKYGENLCINLELPDDEYALAENLEAYKGPWNTIPHKDLEISVNDKSDSAMGSAVLEVKFNHQLLRYGCTLVVAASNISFEEELKRCTENIAPVIIYAFHTESFSTKEIQDLELLKEITNFQPICFVHVPDPYVMPHIVAGNPFCGVVHSQKLPGDGHSSQNNSVLSTVENNNNTVTENAQANSDSAKSNDKCDKSGIQNAGDHSPRNDNNFETGKSDIDKINANKSSTPSSEPSSTPTVTSPSHRMGKVFATSIPPPICQKIFMELCKVGYLTETPGVRNISRNMLEDYFEVDSILITDLKQFQDSFSNFSELTMQRFLVNAVTVLNNTHIRCLNTFIICAFDMAREVLITPKKIEFAREKEEELFKSLMKIAIEKGDEIKDMIERTVQDSKSSLVQKAYDYDFIGVDFTEKGEILTHKGLKICTGQIQELVLGGLNQAVAGKLVNSVDIMRDSYTGTLTRCLESLEKVEIENPGNSTTTEALKQMLLTAYRLEINLDISLGFGFRKKMKKLVQAMPWSQSPKIDDEWKTKVASDMLASLSAARLAKSISSQIKDRLNKSHEAFLSALKQLEMKHCGRLDKIEEERLKLRKVHAPRVAKVALESTSLKDLILHGMPQMGKEIGRGQYGVVYACDRWAGHTPCAIKSVVPPDDKHWNDLALEFFYTKNIPDHDRVVMLRGSIIDYTYGGGTTPAVLLVMDRLQRDLYTAIKQHLDWVGRLQVSIDVVEGIRFLHSQGLVHRDIKLKNVLLDSQNRGKITDLGFCKPEAMMSGSIVGTPIHMAPELFTGRYDSSVDVYAFGILFWYICAGSVRLPQNFEQCANKDQLWTNVKRGLRPESLPVFDDECWDLMTECWECEPVKRPLLGDVQQRLIKIYERYRNKPGGPVKTAKDSASVKISKLKYKTKTSDKK